MKIILVSDVKKEMDRRTKSIMDGTAKPGHRIVMTPEIFSKVFSPKRIRLLMEMKKREFESISDLARQVGRKFEAVHRDISYLKGRGLITVKKINNRAIPKVKKIEIPAIV